MISLFLQMGEGTAEVEVAFAHIRQTLRHAAGASPDGPLRRYSGVLAGLGLLAEAPAGGLLGALMVASHKELLQELSKVGERKCVEEPLPICEEGC